MEENIKKKVQSWLDGDYDVETKEQINTLALENSMELIDAFYKNLEFGTGGLRGIMGVGTNRMNKYTVGAATQGFANYLKKCFPKQPIKVAIAYDSRLNSNSFAQITADVFSANKIFCYLFEELRPVPLLSFTVRHLECQAGVMITASHNPKEYNGYKAYWQDGGQLVPPHDENVIAHVNRVRGIDQVKWTRNENYIQMIGKEIDDAYLEKIKSLSFNIDSIEKRKKFKVLYTPLHGTGITLVPKALKNIGFKHVIIVEDQKTPDGNFPTVVSPNPEEKEAMQIAMLKAQKISADIVLATDPDADRLAVAVRDGKGGYYRLNGNETAVLLTNYILRQLQNRNQLTESMYIVKTIVTTELLPKLALAYNVGYFDVLTGFKYIADIMLQLEGKQQFICGGEESYGFLIGDFVRDKDAVSACCLMAELAAQAITDNSYAFKELLKIYKEYGIYKEDLLSITKKGKDGLEEIKKMMHNYREKPPVEINKSKVVMIKDYWEQVSINCLTGAKTPISLPQSDVLQFFTADDTKVTIRPSGTEPKIKFYFAVKGELKKFKSFDKENQKLADKIQNVIQSLKLN